MSDVFTALAEDRPYCKGFAKEKICELLTKSVSEERLDSNVVDSVAKNIDEFYALLKTE